MRAFYGIAFPLLVLALVVVHAGTAVETIAKTYRSVNIAGYYEGVLFRMVPLLVLLLVLGIAFRRARGVSGRIAHLPFALVAAGTALWVTGNDADVYDRLVRMGEAPPTGPVLTSARGLLATARGYAPLLMLIGGATAVAAAIWAKGTDRPAP